MRHLVPSNTKFIAGAKAFRVWLETDEQHLNIGEVLTSHIDVGRRVIVPEKRYQPVAPVPLEDYQHGTGPAQTPKIQPQTGGMRVFDDFDDQEAGLTEAVPPDRPQ